MDKYEYRRQRLIELKDKFCDGKISVLAERLKRSHSYVSRMLFDESKANRKRIGDDMLDTISEAFGVTKAWLEGESTEILTESAGPSTPELTKEEAKLLKYFRSADRDGRKTILNVASAVASAVVSASKDKNTLPSKINKVG